MLPPWPKMVRCKDVRSHVSFFARLWEPPSMTELGMLILFMSCVFLWGWYNGSAVIRSICQKLLFMGPSKANNPVSLLGLSLIFLVIGIGVLQDFFFVDVSILQSCVRCHPCLQWFHHQCRVLVNVLGSEPFDWLIFEQHRILEWVKTPLVIWWPYLWNVISHSHIELSHFIHGD
jgi:hypothetical protein